MAYTNPGAAAVQGLQEWVTARDAKLRQSAIDDLNKQKTLLEIQAEQDKIKNEEQDRARSDFKLKTANLMPGDVPDAMTIAEGDKLGMPLPIKVQPGNINEGPMPDGSIVPPDPDKNIYLGDRNYQMAQRQAADMKTAADAKHQQDLAEQQAKEQRFADAMGDGTKAPREVIRDIVKAGYTTEDAKRVIDSMQTGVPVYKNNRDGSVTQYDPASRAWVAPTQIQEKAHWITEPAPTNIHISNGAGEKSGSQLLDEMTPEEQQSWRLQVERGALAGAPDPAFGSGTVGAQSRKIYNAMLGRMAQEQGVSGAELANRAAHYKANVGSLSTVQKNSDAVQSFMRTADSNAGGLFEDVLDEIPDSGYTVVNKVWRPLKGAVSQDAQSALSTFNTVRQSLQSEYARIISQPSLSGQLTDSARKEMETILNPASAVPAIRKALTALRAEGTNRENSLGAQISDIDRRMGIGAPSTPTAPPAETPEQRRQRLLTRGYLKP